MALTEGQRPIGDFYSIFVGNGSQVITVQAVHIILGESLHVDQQKWLVKENDN